MYIIYSFNLIQAYLLNVYNFLGCLRSFRQVKNDAPLPVKHAERNTESFSRFVFGQILIFLSFFGLYVICLFFFINLRALLMTQAI